MDPDIGKSLTPVHVSKKCLAALQRELWNIFEYPNHVWLPCNVYTSKTGNFFSLPQFPDLDTFFFPGTVQRCFFCHSPFSKRAPLKWTGPFIYNGQNRRFWGFTLGGTRSIVLRDGRNGQQDEQKQKGRYFHKSMFSPRARRLGGEQPFSGCIDSVSCPHAARYRTGSADQSTRDM